MGSELAKSHQQHVQHPVSGTQPLTKREVRPEIAKTTSAHIAIYLGPRTANAAVKACAMRALGRDPENLEMEDVPDLMAALRPMLGTLLGNSTCEILLHRIERAIAS
jgi:hypothetical protein